MAGGAAALNELIERHADAAMNRTRDRPLPAGRLSPDAALLIGFGLSAGGLLYLFYLVSALPAVLAALTLGTYLFAYTPLKRVTSLNTIVGAIPGALPPVIGWAAARGTLGVGAWALFAILFCWQMPHFLAIAWMYREDYARGGFVMLPNVDSDGASTGRQAVNYSFALLLVSLTPTLLGFRRAMVFLRRVRAGGGDDRLRRAPATRARPHARAAAFFRVDHLSAAAAGAARGGQAPPRDMNAVSPETRARNLVTFVLLVLFAFGLCAYVLVSMRVHARRQRDENARRPRPHRTCSDPA